MEERIAYRDKVMHAVVGAIVEASATEVDGEPACFLSARDILDALAIVTAGLLESAPSCQTPKGLREVSDAFARNVRLQTKAMQRIYEETGRRFFPVDSIMSS